MSTAPGEASAAHVEDGAEVLESLPDAVFVLEEGPALVWVNRAAEQLLGRPRSELLGRPCVEVLHLFDADGSNICFRAPVGRKLPLVKGLPERDYELAGPDGKRFPVTVRCLYQKDGAQVVRRIVCTMRDARARRGMDMRTVELISTVSHEIRSPLTSIKGFTKTLLDRWERFDDDLKREMLVNVNTDADRVTRLLGELLDISRLEAGRLRLRLSRFDLAGLASDVVEKQRQTSERHRLELDFPERGPEIVADRDKVAQVLTNLIENALKYTEHGKVTVSGRADGGWIHISVADEGEGIPPSHIPLLFRKFYRRDRAGSPTGTGLGLYICKGLIEAHGGRLEVASQPGAGSVFTFRLPLLPEAS